MTEPLRPSFNSLIPRPSLKLAMDSKLEHLESVVAASKDSSLSDSHIITSGKEALAYWFWVRSKYVGMAKDLEAQVLLLEPLELRWLAAAIIDTLSENLGHLVASIPVEGGGLQIDGVHLDPEVIEAMANNLHASFAVENEARIIELFSAAFEWLRSWMDGKSSVGVAWVIGKAELPGRHLRFSDSDRVVYSTSLGRVIGIGSHSSVNKPGYFIWEIPNETLWPTQKGKHS